MILSIFLYWADDLSQTYLFFWFCLHQNQLSVALLSTQKTLKIKGFRMPATGIEFNFVAKTIKERSFENFVVKSVQRCVQTSIALLSSVGTAIYLVISLLQFIYNNTPDFPKLF